MMHEGKRIAEARGVALADDPWLMNVKAVSHGQTGNEEYGHVTSMLEDVRNRRLDRGGLDHRRHRARGRQGRRPGAVSTKPCTAW